jgi:ABC-type nickel/cobalt efflux system permease component RcnA
VPDEGYYRTIEVQLAPDRVRVKYCLEVDPLVVRVDVIKVCSRDEFPKLVSEAACCEAFTRGYAPLIAANIVASLDRKPLWFECVQHAHRQAKEGDEVKAHIACDYVFEARWKPAPGQAHAFAFQEKNFSDDTKGKIDLKLTALPGVSIVKRVEPDEALKGKPYIDLKSSEREQRLQVAAEFTISADAPPVPALPPAVNEPRKVDGFLGLLDTPHGLAVLLVLAAGFGAAHALMPGHGKTLVAAYLVGENGTVGHALLLGLVTTLTHTGAVIVLAAALPWLMPKTSPADVEFVLRLGGGLLIVGLGFWLLMRRLAGQADHIHLGGHGHHHHHDSEADHYHDHHGHAHPLPKATGWAGILILGIQGGLIPCWDAVALFLFAVSSGNLIIGLPLLLAFSAGLAAVLVAIGIGIVYAKGLAAGRWGDNRVFRALPLISAVLITGMGLWLCYSSLNPPA